MALASTTYNINTKTNTMSPTTVIIDSGASGHFFSNEIFFTSYENRYHKFKAESGKILTAYGTEIVKINALLMDGSINVITVSNIN